MVRYSCAVICALLFSACREQQQLPILGEMVADPETGSLSYYQVPQFRLTNQLNEVVQRNEFDGKIQVVDFFFTSCPTICPRMTSHMKLVEDRFSEEDRVAIISYSIDAEYDTPEKLKAYAEAYEVSNQKWTFLTGSSDVIFELAKDYKVRAFDDSYGEKRNLVHDGTFVLIDGQHRIRGYYNGLDEKDTHRLMGDIDLLLTEG